MRATTRATQAWGECRSPASSAMVMLDPDQLSSPGSARKDPQQLDLPDGVDPLLGVDRKVVVERRAVPAVRREGCGVAEEVHQVVARGRADLPTGPARRASRRPPGGCPSPRRRDASPPGRRSRRGTCSRQQAPGRSRCVGLGRGRSRRRRRDDRRRTGATSPGAGSGRSARVVVHQRLLDQTDERRRSRRCRRHRRPLRRRRGRTTTGTPPAAGRPPAPVGPADRGTTTPRPAACGGVRGCGGPRTAAGTARPAVGRSRRAPSPAPGPRPARSPGGSRRAASRSPPRPPRSRRTARTPPSPPIARSTNSRTADAAGDPASSASASGTARDRTPRTVSPSTPSGSRDVATIVGSGPATRIASARPAASFSTCSQLSSTTSTRRSAR